MAREPYDHQSVEQKWQKQWQQTDAFRAADHPTKPKAYILDMFPYPSGDGLHVGHPEGYTASDILSRYLRMQGRAVLHPMGWDAFGLPAENYAIKTGTHPSVTTKKNIETFKRQIQSLGFAYDWSREVNTTDPGYYKWTQWIFLKLFEKGLAYEAEAPINWCPKDKTGLANEEVVGGKCERCGTPVEKKNIRQWLVKITDAKYIERLLNDLDKLDWPESIKQSQRNWIGKSEGALVNFELRTENQKSEKRNSTVLRSKFSVISVFTTRPDTLYGATYMVLSPEHPLVAQITTDTQRKAVEKYQQQASHKSDLERTELVKEKTGVFTGAYATNPVNQERIPIWIADYVLPSYGTGAIMAVPAHDERDYAFAKQYELPIRRVIEPKFVATSGESAVQEGADFVKRNAICAIVRNPKDDTYLCISWKTVHMHGMVTGGVEAGEDIVAAAMREIREETGYTHVRLVRNPDFALHSLFYHRVKKENRWARFQYLFFELENEARVAVTEKEASLHEVFWKRPDELENFFSVIEGEFILHFIKNPDYIHTGEGVMVTPSPRDPLPQGEREGNYDGPYEGLTSQEFRKAIVAWLEKTGKGRAAVNYKLRDWVFSRQRYWGEPIPIVHCPKDGNVAVPETQLPVVLPDVKKYEPTGTGESPLAGMKDWVSTTCPKCGGPAKRETNTMPQWAGSNWYFLRYCDPHNDKQLANPAKLKAWLPVDTYIGGAEHAVLHLLYARFIYKFLFDIGAVPKEVGDEPFTKLINQGLILAEDGQKMSKSRGNVINPDLIVREYGADSLRMFEMFMGPLQDAKPWSTRGIVGVRRFLEKVWQLQEKVKDNGELHRETHALIKQIGDDITSFSLNTAVSSFMKWTNATAVWESISKNEFGVFLTLLSPFAPHLAQELWAKLGHADQVHDQQWPSFDASKVVAENVEVVVQVNGKVRDKFTVASGISEEELKAQALASKKIQTWLGGKQPKKIIVVKGKLVSIVI